MKTISLLTICISLLLLSCKKTTKTESKLTVSEKNYDWLLGKWERIEDDSLKQTFELWTKTDQTYYGHGYILEQKDTVWEERMTLKPNRDIWELTVNTPGQKDAVTFKETSYNDSLFTVENRTHDFPKKIVYWKQQDQLHAEVSSDEATIAFKFKPIQ